VAAFHGTPDFMKDIHSGEAQTGAPPIAATIVTRMGGTPTVALVVGTCLPATRE
jgi:hypothetical protein